MKKQGGFTLVELLFTVIVLAVLLAIGVPNFRAFVQNGRMTAAANDLLADVSFARSEAVKRRVPVTLCKSADGASCDADASTSFARWIVFVDDADSSAVDPEDGNGAVDDDEVVLRDRSIGEGIEGTANGELAVYRTNGFPNAAIAGNVTRVLFCDERGSADTVGGVSAARGVLIGTTGRASVTREKATIIAAVSAGGFGGCP